MPSSALLFHQYFPCASKEPLVILLNFPYPIIITIFYLSKAAAHGACVCVYFKHTDVPNRLHFSRFEPHKQESNDVSNDAEIMRIPNADAPARCWEDTFQRKMPLLPVHCV
jgi:hypothetical protein